MTLRSKKLSDRCLLLGPVSISSEVVDARRGSSTLKSSPRRGTSWLCEVYRDDLLVLINVRSPHKFVIDLGLMDWLSDSPCYAKPSSGWRTITGCYIMGEREMLHAPQDVGRRLNPLVLPSSRYLNPSTNPTNQTRSDEQAGTPIHQLSGIGYGMGGRAEEIVVKKGIILVQGVVARSLAKDGATGPIVNTTSLQNMAGIIGGVHVKLSEDEIRYPEGPDTPQATIRHA
ncbi:hypothetical protein JAAARDRAFT_199294 [Jaapia argillacea MUCL 33604]|uniref:Uncharacterized protein n=1 Tax=Jaapia argillacea MUCL 33604 TaxID=933084 RepID=A0A067P8Z8_9AGAM|nr:hypothetical protein JAAARDRAFT_199294 [Jaapia argillacea MUCL 33604]